MVVSGGRVTVVLNDGLVWEEEEEVGAAMSVSSIYVGQISIHRLVTHPPRPVPKHSPPPPSLRWCARA